MFSAESYPFVGKIKGFQIISVFSARETSSQLRKIKGEICLKPIKMDVI